MLAVELGIEVWRRSLLQTLGPLQKMPFLACLLLAACLSLLTYLRVFFFRAAKDGEVGVMPPHDDQYAVEEKSWSELLAHARFWRHISKFVAGHVFQ